MILTGIAVAILIAIGAGYFMLGEGEKVPAWRVYSSDSTRVGDPGSNLVGPAWTGEAGAPDASGETTQS